MTAYYPYSVQTGTYDIDQLGGEKCARCGKWFRLGDKTREHERLAEWTLYAHNECPTAVKAA